MKRQCLLLTEIAPIFSVSLHIFGRKNFQGQCWNALRNVRRPRENQPFSHFRQYEENYWTSVWPPGMQYPSCLFWLVSNYCSHALINCGDVKPCIMEQRSHWCMGNCSQIPWPHGFCRSDFWESFQTRSVHWRCAILQRARSPTLWKVAWRRSYFFLGKHQCQRSSFSNSSNTENPQPESIFSCCRFNLLCDANSPISGGLTYLNRMPQQDDG